MEVEEDFDDFVELDCKRAQRRLKVLQRQHTPSHKAATTSNQKRKTPASAQTSSKRSALTPKSFAAVGSTPKAPAKSLQHASPAVASADDCCTAGAGANQQRHDTQQLQQAANVAETGSAAVLAPTCLVSSPEQEVPDVGPDSGVAEPSPAAQRNSCRYSGVQQINPFQAEAAAEAAGCAVAAAGTADSDAPTSAACPVCGSRLADMSSTEAGQAAHVNACLDAAAAAHEADPPVDTATDAAAALAPEDKWEQQQQQESEVIDVADVDDDVASWLESIGAAAVAGRFAAAELDLSLLPHLNEHDLEEMGITDAAQRQLILAAAADHAAGRSTHADCEGQQQQQQQQQQQHGIQLEQQPQRDLDDELYGWDDGDGLDEDLDAAAWQAAEAGHLPPAADAWGADDRQAGQQQQQQGLPLQPVQAHACNIAARQRTNGSNHLRTAATNGQSSIRGWLQQGQQQQQSGDVQQQQQVSTDGQQRQGQPQQCDAKQQWQSLFNRPGKVLAPQQPLQPKQRPKSQMQLGQGGRLQQPPQPQPQQPRAADQHMLASLPSTRSGPLPSWWPVWRCLPGTSIIVDAFGQSSKALGGGRTWVLTHFHADHYMGLGKGFKQGRILCTPATAALVRLKLRVPEQLLVPLPLGQEISVEGTRLQFVDANHCPGSAMVVAQPPGGLPPVLHTGDARLTREATQQQPALQALVGRAVLVLDTTYADPSYCFPPQQEVLQWVLRAVQAESFNPRCLFLFGSYTIGKERLFLHVAAALRSKVYVAAAKRSILACLDLPPEQAALLTTNHLEANIHVVPMRQVTLEAMESLLLRYKGRYTAVVGFQPTGWSHTAGGGGGRAVGGQASRASSSVKGGKRLQRGTVVLYKVPYSEHSSCAELREFVAWLKPIRIIPSVSNDGGDKLRKMLAAVTSSGKASGPMDAWVQGQQQQQQQALQ